MTLETSSALSAADGGKESDLVSVIHRGIGLSKFRVYGKQHGCPMRFEIGKVFGELGVNSPYVRVRGRLQLYLPHAGDIGKGSEEEDLYSHQ